MNILWFSMFPFLSDILNALPNAFAYNVGGWMEGMSRAVIESENNLTYTFTFDTLTEGKISDSLDYYSFKRIDEFTEYTDDDINRLKYVLDKAQPDIIHIFGTEYTHQAQLIKMLNKLGYIDKTVIWIQGIVSVYAKNYKAGLDEKIINHRTLKEYIKHNNINDMRLQMQKQGEEEIEALKIAKHIFVRTHWDKAECTAINPDLILHTCNETLRPQFYESRKWSYAECEKHTIFVSQANYPIKAFHKLLEAMPIVLEKYPDTKIYTTGVDYLNYTSPVDKLKLSTYQKHIIKLVKKYNLNGKITFSGSLNANQMIEHFLNANVFVSPSSIENSPNSVGEAMILGVPVVSSDVGGVSTMLENNVEGLLYDFNDTVKLAENICKIFDSIELAEKLSANAIKKAELTHNKQINFDTLIKEYKKICG